MADVPSQILCVAPVHRPAVPPSTLPFCGPCLPAGAASSDGAPCGSPFEVTLKAPAALVDHGRIVS
jgi:hypothetical protein